MRARSSGFPTSRRTPRRSTAHGARAAIYGIPWDSTSISRTGANYGPRGIREISSQFLTFNATWDFDLVEALNPVDCGDCDVVLANAERTFERAEADIGAMLTAGALPATIGGDHSVTIPAVRAVSKQVSDPGLVLIDTHLDTAQDVGGEELNHCCPITRAVDAGFDPRKMALLAISGWMNPRTELSYCRERGITVVWLEDIWEKGVAAAVDTALEVAGQGSDGIYLSVDVDSLDAAYAPGTCVPDAGRPDQPRAARAGAGGGRATASWASTWSRPRRASIRAPRPLRSRAACSWTPSRHTREP